jgi:hypothetical protein
MIMLLKLSRCLLPRAASLRLGAYLAVVFGVLLVVSGYSLYAHAKDAALAFGAELAGLADLTGGAEVIRVNGERFHHSLVIVDGEPAAILDRLQAECEAHPGLMGQTLADAAARAEAAGASELVPPSNGGVVRHESDGRGMLVCWVSDERSGLAALGERIEAFARTSQLSVFGRARYAYVEVMPGHQLRVMTLWADTDLDLSRLFPARGDAAGVDSRVLPRPPQSTRLLSAAADGMPFVLLHYVSRTPKPELAAFYERWFTENGWRRVEAPPAATTAYQRADGHQVFLSLLEQGTGSQVTVVESGAATAVVQVEG